MATTELRPTEVARVPVAGPSRAWAVAGVALLALAHGPLLLQHALQLWLRPHYQFFPLVLLGAAVLAWDRLRGLGTLTPGPRGVVGLLVGLDWLLLAAAWLLYSSWLAAVATMVLLAAVLVGLGGARLFLRALPAWAFLWLLVPPPFELDRNLVLALQTLTTQWSSRLLDYFGVFHVMAGHVVELGGRRLLVEESCGGVNSLLSVLACTVFFVLLVRRPPVRAVLLVLSALAWVLVANVARVVLVTSLCVQHGIDLTEGWRHDALGLVLFGLALLLIWSTDRLFLFLSAPAAEAPGANEAPAENTEATPTRWPDLSRTWLAAWPTACFFGALCVAYLGLYGFHGGATPEGDVPAWVATVDTKTLPEALGKWQRQKYASPTRNPGSAFGEFSRAWTYGLGQNQATFSLDYPFPAWHDLTRCYTSQGWALEEQALEPAQGQGTAARPGYVAVKMTRPGARSGYLLFCQFDGRGVALEPRRGGAYLSLYRHGSAWRHLLEFGGQSDEGADPEGPVYQFQLFLESYSPLTPAGQAEARDLFRQGVVALRRPLGEARASARR
jgi:exosortase